MVLACCTLLNDARIIPQNKAHDFVYFRADCHPPLQKIGKQFTICSFMRLPWIAT